jgi:flagellar biosynthesis component FlhA
MYQKGGLAQSEILDLIFKIDFEEKEPKINFKFNEVKKDLNCGMGFVNPNITINQNTLGHSQSWRFKKQKKYNYYG